MKIYILEFFFPDYELGIIFKMNRNIILKGSFFNMIGGPPMVVHDVMKFMNNFLLSALFLFLYVHCSY